MNDRRPGTRNAPPHPAALVESLRGLGYSTPTAVADLVDNSIAAGAGQVSIRFSWEEPDTHVSVLDDGFGMNALELENAMRLGAKNPLDTRRASDLGRFGLGLKTASFSQCRRLTVATMKDGKFNSMRWDLDVLAASRDGDWPLLEGPEPGEDPLLEPLLEARQGTLVLWQLPDRILTRGFTVEHMLDLVDRVEQHLAMVFHRFLAGPTPQLGIHLNGRPVAPWDPYLEGHPATWSSPIENLLVGGVAVELQCHVLPHRDHWTASIILSGRPTIILAGGGGNDCR